MKIIIMCFFLSMTLSMCSDSGSVKSVDYVDLNKYLGKWYEIASLPQKFQKGCHNTTATYTLNEKGYVIVENRCNKDSLKGPVSYVKGKAFVVPGTGNAQLKVQFFWPFKGKYWIIDLDQDYNYAVVGHPNKKYLWILSRKSTLDPKVYDKIIKNLENVGFDTSSIVKTHHD